MTTKTTRKPRKPKPAPIPVTPAPPTIDPWDIATDAKSLPLESHQREFAEALDQAADLLKASHGDPGIGSIVQIAANELRRFYCQRNQRSGL